MGERIPLPMPFGWFRVSESEELARGAERAVHSAGRELVVFRGEDGEAHVLDAHCPHLGAHLGHGGRVVENTIRAGGEVPLKGLGKFKVQNRKARMGRNPATGEAIQIGQFAAVQQLARDIVDEMRSDW